MGSRSRTYSRSRSPSPRRTSTSNRGNDRDRRSPARYDRSGGRPEYRNGGDRGGDRYGDRRDSGRPRYDDRSRRNRNADGRENPRPSNCLGIFGMSMNTNERDLREIFEKYGRVDSVKIIMDHGTGRSRGFGFVTFEDRSDATRAWDMLQARDKIADTVIDGMKVRVDFAIQRRRSPGPRGGRSPVRSGGGGARYSRSPVRSSARYSKSPSR